jgi:hypothetical protein
MNLRLLCALTAGCLWGSFTLLTGCGGSVVAINPSAECSPEDPCDGAARDAPPPHDDASTVGIDANTRPIAEAGVVFPPEAASGDAPNAGDAGSDAYNPLDGAPVMACSGECVCQGGASSTDVCNFQCTVPSCSIVCQDEAACGGSCGADCQVTCQSTTLCDFRCGDGCNYKCQGAQECDAQVGSGGTVVCQGSQECRATVGDGGTVTCQGAESCDVTCTGDCTVVCQSAACRVGCAPGAQCNLEGCAPVTQCPNGAQVCGQGC